MKKVLLPLLLALFAAAPASAGIFKYGIEGGVNFNKMKVNKDVFSSDNQVGWFVGPKIQLTVPGIGLMIDAAAQYSQSKMSVTGETLVGDPTSSTEAAITTPVTSKETLPYIVVPVNLKYGIGLGSQASVYISTGPQWNWYVGDTTLKTFTQDLELQRNTFSWNFGVGFHLLGHLQVGATYNLGFGKSFADVKEASIVNSFKDADWKNNGFQVRLAYMF